MVTHHYAQSNGIRMHYATAGEGPAVMMLHGFPQSWYTWRHQLDGLAEGGYTAIAPDLRGYGDTDRPASGYSVDNLVGDVGGLIDSLGLEELTLVGTDWGGPIAWAAAERLPQVSRLVQLNGPHPSAFARKLFTSRQFIKSWYFYGFMVPGLAERLLRSRDYAALKRIYEDGQKRAPDTITDADVDHMMQAIRQPGALECGLKYYRATANPRSWREAWSMKPVTRPTLAVWGLKDVALVPQSQTDLRPWVDAHLEVRYVHDAGHWLGEERPADVNRMIVSFIRSRKSGRAQTAQ